VYSPKIREDLIPKIYHLAKAKGLSMTTLVNEILDEAVNGEVEIREKEERHRKRNE
jgi:hypothetical protein